MTKRCDLWSYGDGNHPHLAHQELGAVGMLQELNDVLPRRPIQTRLFRPSTRVGVIASAVFKSAIPDFLTPSVFTTDRFVRWKPSVRRSESGCHANC